MSQVANQVNLPEACYSGGQILDETKIHPYTTTVPDGETIQLIGFVDTDTENEVVDLNIIEFKDDEQDLEQDLAEDVPQLIFQSGFQFPIVHFPSSGVKASELYLHICEAVSGLQQRGFNVDCIMQV